MQHMPGARFTWMDCARWCYIFYYWCPWNRDWEKPYQPQKYLSLFSTSFSKTHCHWNYQQRIHKPGYLSHKEYKYPSPTTTKSMAVFISSKWCAFKEQHFHAGWIVFALHVQMHLSSISSVKWELQKQIGGIHCLKQIWQVIFKTIVKKKNV